MSSSTIILKDFYSYLQPRARDAHKNCFGHVLVVGGNWGMVGAVSMAAEAAARVGAGLVSVATRAEQALMVTQRRPEIMSHAIDEVDAIKPLLAKATVVALGPGLGLDQWAQTLWQAVLATDLPIVLDADGLNLLANQFTQRENWILTPHPGEAKRLLSALAVTMESERIKQAQTLQKYYNGITVLKGAGTIVQTASASSLCQAGNPGMASGGMGDVLTGVIAGLVAQGLPLEIAAQCGVCLHAEAGDLAAQQGQRGLLATDLMPYLRQLVNPLT